MNSTIEDLPKKLVREAAIRENKARAEATTKRLCPSLTAGVTNADGTFKFNLGQTVELAPGPRICIVGYGRHGKDEAALTLHGLGNLRYFGSTSWAALPDMAEVLDLPQQVAWETRHSNREFWKSHCDYLRRDDPLYLIRKVLARGNICAGIRDKVEIQAAIDQQIFDAVVWIERPGFPADATVTFTRELATSTIINNGTLKEFHAKVKSWAYRMNFISHNDL